MDNILGRDNIFGTNKGKFNTLIIDNILDTDNVICTDNHTQDWENLSIIKDIVFIKKWKWSTIRWKSAIDK